MQSCASCHLPQAGFADPDRNLPTSEGAVRGRFGNRNLPTSAYAAFIPEFRFDSTQGRYLGGQFWDERAKDLVEQAKGPLLNPLEMNNPSKAAGVSKVQQAHYAPLFTQVFGPNAFSNVDQAYHNIATAIAAFERTTFFSPFTSKYDAYLAGSTPLGAQEQQGLALFEGKGRCNTCHTSRSPNGMPPIFTNFSYENLGVPRNLNNPFYRQALQFNPDEANFIDYGLGAMVKDSRENGKFKVPTLRNIALTSPYMHNGLYSTLEQAVQFHNSKVVGTWQPPEVDQNVNSTQVGNLGLSTQEIADIVVFLRTLTDAPPAGDGMMTNQGVTANEPGDPNTVGSTPPQAGEGSDTASGGGGVFDV